jgi:hypothetical protein
MERLDFGKVINLIKTEEIIKFYGKFFFLILVYVLLVSRMEMRVAMPIQIRMQFVGPSVVKIITTIGSPESSMNLSVKLKPAQGMLLLVLAFC